MTRASSTLWHTSMSILASQLVSLLRAFLSSGFDFRYIFSRITLGLCAWAGWLYWLARVYERHWNISDGERSGLSVVLAVICLFHAVFFGSHGRQLKELIYFLIGPCILLPFVLVSVVIWRIISLPVFLFVVLKKFCPMLLPRYRQSTYKDKLCSTCELLVDKSPLLIGTRKLFTLPAENHCHYNAQDLQESAKGCHMCSTLLRSVESFRNNLASSSQRPKKTSFRVEPPSIAPSSPGGKLTVRVWEKRPLGQEPLLRIQLLGEDITTSLPLNVEEINNGRGRHDGAPSFSTNSPADMSLISQWIVSCRRNHSICQSNFQSNFIPENQIESSPRLRLVETLTPSAPGTKGMSDYCTLSHQWGGIIDMRLLQNNQRAILQSIDLTKLPKTFQDAISVTRGLRVGYLWVDSLCIMQDSAVDWQRESPKMGHIYAKAVCTISATASENSEGGCFFPKEPFLSDCVLRTQRGCSLTIRSSVRDLGALENLFNQRIEHAPLITRAWTFQERVLAPRVLHFCDGVVLFECNTLRASEYHIDGVPYTRKTNVRSDGKLHDAVELQRLNQREPEYQQVTEQVWKRDPAPHKPSRVRTSSYVPQTTTRPNPDYRSRQDNIAEILRISAQSGMRGAFEFLLHFKGKELAEKIEFHQSWYEMVEQYSVRNLTKHTDKMMAIAGVAYFVQMSTNLRYISGLWVETLPLNLLWTVVGSPRVRPERPVPTWSWASVDGGIYHRLTVPSSEYLNTLRTSTSPPSATTNTAQTPDATIFQTTREDIQTLISDETVHPLSEINSLVSNATLELSCKLIKFDLSKINFIPDIALEHLNDELFCLPVLSFKNSYVHPVGSPLQLHGIVLRARQSGIRRYEMVGYFWTAKHARDLLNKISDGGARSTIQLV